MHLDAPLAAARRGRAGAAQFRVAVLAVAPDKTDRARDLLVAVAATQQRAQVVSAAGEQTQEELAFGGQPGPVAVAAEGLRDAADDADLAAAVRIAPALRGFTGRIRLQRLSAVFPLEPLRPNAAGETAERWRYVDGGGEIGVISSVTRAFCRDCNRARLSTEGKLFLCLFASRGHDLRALLRGDYTDEQIAGAIGLIWGDREDRYSELRGAGTASAGSGERRVEMHYIGG